MNNKINIEENIKAIESFNNFIKAKEKEQETLYENEEFYKDDIEQNELFLKMLHSVSKAIQTLKVKANKYDGLIEKIENKFKTRRIELLKKDKEPENDIVLDTLQELLDTKQ